MNMEKLERDIQILLNEENADIKEVSIENVIRSIKANIENKVA